MAAANKPTAVHYSLIVFVMTTIIGLVAAFLYRRDLLEETAKLNVADDKARTAQALSDSLASQILAIKDVIGHGYDQVGTKEDTNPTTVLGAMKQDIATYAPDLQAATYKDVLASLSQELTNAKREVASLQASLNDHRERMGALQAQYQQMVNEHDEAKRAALEDNTAVVQKQKEYVDAKNQEIAAAEERARNAQSQYEELREQTDAQIDELQNEITLLTTRNDMLQNRYNEALDVSFEVEDGNVVHVDQSRLLVWINLGEADGLRKQTTFSVYRRGHQGVGRRGQGASYGGEDIKAAIEVTEILGAHRAEARIIEQDVAYPIMPGDPIYTPLWTAGRAEKFAVVGMIDIDGDDRNDREEFHEIVRSAGAEIGLEVSDQGETIGGPLTSDIKMLIVGDIPVYTDAPNERLRAEYQAISQAHTTLEKTARQQGVRVITLPDFLTLIGYRPTRRIWTQGADWNLKAGQGAAGVDRAAAEQLRPLVGEQTTKYRYGRDQRMAPIRKFSNRADRTGDTGGAVDETITPGSDAAAGGGN